MFSLTLISQLISFLGTLSLLQSTTPKLEAANININVDSPHSQPRRHTPAMSTNPKWSGAVISADSGTKYTSITATLVLPIPSLPSSSMPNTTYTASSYVALGGDPCQGLLQVGMDINATLIGDGGQVAAYDAWYQWNPANYTIFDSIPFSAGDIIYLNITLTNSTSATITVKNLNTNSTVTQDVSSPYELCQTDAEWAVSDYNDDLGPEVVYVDYGNVTFGAVKANIVRKGGEEGSVGADGARVVLQNRGDEMLTKVEVTERSVTVIYDGYHDEE